MSISRDRILKIGESYREAKLLLAAAANNIFDFLEEPRSAGEVASMVKAEHRGLELMLNALVAMGYLEKYGGMYRNSEVASSYLVSSSREYLGYSLKHANHGFERWAGLDRKIFSQPREETTIDFLLALDSMADVRARELAGSVNLEGRESLVDLGGGSGAYSIAFAHRYGVKPTIVELPDKAQATREILRQKGWESIDVVEGDFLEGGFGRGYQAALVSNIVHFLSEGENRRLLDRVHSALAPEGLLVLHDFILNASRTWPRHSTIFSVHMLLSSSGRCYSWSELEGWLLQAGFSELERKELSETGVILGRAGY